MTDTIVVTPTTDVVEVNPATDVIEINSVTDVVEITSTPDSVVVQDTGVQGPPGPQGEPGTPGIAVVNFVIDGSGAVIPSGTKGSVTVPFNCVISSWTLTGDTVGSIQIDLWKAAFASYPPTVSNTISPTNKAKIVSDIKASSSTLTGWSPSISANDILVFNVDSASGIGRATLGLGLTRV